MHTMRWRLVIGDDTNKIHNSVYTRIYLCYSALSEPHEEWDDRNRMYSMYYNVIYSVNHGDQGTAVWQWCVLYPSFILLLK